jgi:hypothetical protein
MPRSENRIKRVWIERLYEGFLRLPVAIVLAVMFLAGIGFVGLLVLALYFLVWLLL